MTRSLDRLTAAEVAGHLERSPRVLLPVGSTEQHGAHAPLGTDAILAAAVCERAAPLVDALVAPAVPFGVSPEHDGFAGLITLTPGTMIRLVREVCVSLARGGFRRVVLVNGHYTNVVALHAAILEANELVPEGHVCYWFSYWDALADERRESYLGEDAGLHANIGETSAIMAVDPSLVRPDLARAEYPAFPPGVGRAAIDAYLFSGRGSLRRVLPGGVWGDPRDSTAERGDAYLDEISRAVAETIVAAETLFDTFGTVSSS